jgi:hypothetical protein
MTIVTGSETSDDRCRYIVPIIFYVPIEEHNDVSRRNQNSKEIKSEDLRFSRRWLWRMLSSGMWRRVDLVWTDVSEERIASIFRVETSASEEPDWSFGYRFSRGDKFLWNVGSPKICTSPHSRRRHSSKSEEYSIIGELLLATLYSLVTCHTWSCIQSLHSPSQLLIFSLSILRVSFLYSVSPFSESASYK